MKIARALVACIAAFAAAHASATTIAPPWRPPVIVVPGNVQPIQLRAASIDTDVLGGQAQTRIELRLYNPNGRVLEGELQFPLQEGQVVTGFALDVGGKLRDAVPVPKARGQEIFEDIRRRRVDPGLLEQTAGNQYKLRVYPLPPQGERRVQVTVTENLARQHGAYLMRIPVQFGAPAAQTKLALRVNGTPRDVSAAGAPNGWVAVTVPVPSGAQATVGESAGKRFFSAQVPVRDELVRRPDPQRIALVWDASGSGANATRVLQVLDAYFRNLRSPAQVTLLVVRNRVEAPRRFTVANGRWDELLAALKAEPFDGSSNFDELPVPADTQATLFVSDGLATDGRRQLNYRHGAPVFAISGSAAADVPRLTRLAERTGGAFVDATVASPADAVRAMAYAGWRIERITSLAADQLVAPSARIRDGLLSIAGELRDSSADVEIQLAHVDGRRRVVPLAVRGAATAGRWPAQQWAQWRGNELAENAALHQAQMREIAALHGLVGADSSLIVLEQAADYARYDLAAPPDLAEEVARLRTWQLAQATQRQHQHIEHVARQFEERQRWWDRDFPKDEPKRAAPEQSKEDAAAALGQARMREETAKVAPQRLASAATAAAPAPAAAPSLRKDAADVAENRAGAPSSVIALQPWTPDAAYLRRMQSAAAADIYRVYLDERIAHTASSAFFMDAASLLFERGEGELALRVLSNLAEMNLENRQLLRMYAYRLVQAKRNDLAMLVFERVAQLAPNEPQSWRDLGLAYADSGLPQRAVEALWQVVQRPWDARFAGVHMIALAELNAIAAQSAAKGLPLDLSRVDPRLRRNLPLDLRIVLAWDTDDTDIDLWVTDPNGELANYRRRLTHQGGAMSPDATGGYGPEEFALKRAKPGRYVVQAQFYGHRQQVLSAGTTVMVRVTTGFGTAAAKDEWLTLRLAQGRELARIGEVEVALP